MSRCLLTTPMCANSPTRTSRAASSGKDIVFTLKLKPSAAAVVCQCCCSCCRRVIGCRLTAGCACQLCWCNPFDISNARNRRLTVDQRGSYEQSPHKHGSIRCCTKQMKSVRWCKLETSSQVLKKAHFTAVNLLPPGRQVDGSFSNLHAQLPEAPTVAKERLNSPVMPICDACAAAAGSRVLTLQLQLSV